MLPAYQVHVATAAAAIALVSALLLALTGFAPEGKIKLTEDADADDPFNVTRPEDVVDGEPLNERGFWVKVRHFAVDATNVAKLMPSTSGATPEACNDNHPCRHFGTANR